MTAAYEAWIAWRYIRSSKRTSGASGGFLSFISFASVAGIALGVWALIVVLSVMNGFQKEVRDRMLSVVAHIEVFAASGSVARWEPLLEEAKRHPRVVAGAPYVMAQAMLANGDGVRGAAIRGILPEQEDKVAAPQMRQGKLADLTPGSFNVVLGQSLLSPLVGVHA